MSLGVGNILSWAAAEVWCGQDGTAWAYVKLRGQT
jgi:hypothetical protein